MDPLLAAEHVRYWCFAFGHGTSQEEVLGSLRVQFGQSLPKQASGFAQERHRNGERSYRDRDRACVYCGTLFATANARRDRPSWEHIVNDARIVTRENIVLCCISCNASKGARALTSWLESKYCRQRGITAASVAAVVQVALALGDSPAP